MIDSNALTHQMIDTGAVRLHVVEKGCGPVVVCLHGFPDFWYSWRNQINALVQAGFRVVVPDLRGYNSSDKPSSVADYRLDELVHDVVGLIEFLDVGPVHLVGHDWGGAIAWMVANDHPECVDHLAILNMPHPERIPVGMKSVSQLLRTCHWLAFQLPWLPEWAMKFNEFAFLKWFLKREGADCSGFSDEDLVRYVKAHSQHGALTAMFNYFRALRYELRGSNLKRLRPIMNPVLILWGDCDAFLIRELAHPAAAWVPNCEVRFIEGAGHWAHVNKPEIVNDSLIEFLNRSKQEVVALFAS